MENWNHIKSTDDISNIISRSENDICLIFKHSTTCSISSMAQMRLQDHIAELSLPVTLFYLDLLNHRRVSAHIADTFQVHHESPQVLLIQGGQCFYDASHFDITISEINEALAFHAKSAI